LAFLSDFGVIFGDMFPDFYNLPHMVLYINLHSYRFSAKNSGELTAKFHPTLQTAIMIATLLAIGLLSFFNTQPFVYENF
jgi:hypothetical protein